MGAVLLITTAAKGAEDPASATELRVGVPRLPSRLDPAAITAMPGGVERALHRLVFQGLVEFGERGEIEPRLASQWTVSRDGLTWSFRIRPDVQFSSGAPVTAEEVAGSLARHLTADLPTGAAAPWTRVVHGSSRIVREVRRGDPGTVQILLAQPFSPLLALLAHPALAITTTQNDSEVRFLGTGPYRQDEPVPGRLVLVARGGMGPPGRPDRLVFVEVADDAAGLAGLAPGGGLDVYFAQAPPAWAGLGLQVLPAPTWQIGLLALRTDRGVVGTKAVRQAIASGLDPAVLQPALGQWGRLQTSYLPPGAWGALPPERSYDLARARQLVAQAGAADAALTLAAPETSVGLDQARVAEAIRVSLAAVGLRLSVRLLPPDAAAEAARGGETDMAIHEATLFANDPHFLLAPLLAADTTNLSAFRSGLVDGLLLRASQLAFRPERRRLYQRLLAQLAEDVPYVPLFVRLSWVLARPGVRGLRVDPTGAHRLEQVRADG